MKKNQELQIIATTDFNNAKKGGIAYKPVTNVYFKPVRLIYVQKGNKIAYDKLMKYFNDCSISLYDDKNAINIIKKSDYDYVGFSDNIMDLDTKELCSYLNIPCTSIMIESSNKDHFNNVYVFILEFFFGQKETKRFQKCFNVPMNILKKALCKLMSNLDIFLQNDHK